MNCYKHTTSATRVAGVTGSYFTAALEARPELIMTENVPEAVGSELVIASLNAAVEGGYSARLDVPAASQHANATTRERLVATMTGPDRTLPPACEPIHAVARDAAHFAHKKFTVSGIAIVAEPDRLGGMAPLPPTTLFDALAGAAPVGSATYAAAPVGRDALAARGRATAVPNNNALRIPVHLRASADSVPRAPGMNAHDMGAAARARLSRTLADGARAMSYTWTWGLAPTLAGSSADLGGKAPPLLAVGPDGHARLWAPAENARVTGFYDGDVCEMSPKAAVRATGMAVPPALARSAAAGAMRAAWYDGETEGELREPDGSGG
jgi:site-specific DNA-cytosine methylase